MELIDGRDLDDDSAAALAELQTVTQNDVYDDEPPVPAAEVVADLRHPPALREHLLWLERGTSGLDGAALLAFEHRPDNPHLAEASVWVRPGARRRSLGRRLLEAMAKEASNRSRTQLLGYAAEGTPGYAFATAAGGVVNLVEHENRLLVADLDRRLLERWVDQATERAQGYSLVPFDDRCPDELLDGFVAVNAVMNDAPKSDSVEDFVFTADEIQQREGSMAARDVRSWVVLARHDATGQIAGLTELTFPPYRPYRAHQGDTGVDPAHRDKGLGRWLKAVNLLRLLDERPAVTEVETWNAGTNRAMLSINHTLGFTRRVAWTELELRL